MVAGVTVYCHKLYNLLLSMDPIGMKLKVLIADVFNEILSNFKVHL